LKKGSIHRNRRRPRKKLANRIQRKIKRALREDPKEKTAKGVEKKEGGSGISNKKKQKT